MQQLSGSVGLGGTRTPATWCEAASISFLRSAGPASFDPKTIRAFVSVSSSSVLGSDSGGGGAGVLRVALGISDTGFFKSSNEGSVHAGVAQRALDIPA